MPNDAVQNLSIHTFKHVVAQVIIVGLICLAPRELFIFVFETGFEKRQEFQLLAFVDADAGKLRVFRPKVVF